MILVLGAALGFISVAFGAFIEHAMREVIAQDSYRFLLTAIRYNQVHAVIICAIGLTLLNGGKLEKLKSLKISGWLLAVGTILFCFSIYSSVLFQNKDLLYITPIGGISLMLGWIMLLFASLIAWRKL